MKIALMMENSQASKNAMVLKELHTVADEKNYPVFNVGMKDEQDVKFSLQVGIEIHSTDELLQIILFVEKNRVMKVD